MVVWFGSKGFYVSREWWEDITVCRSARRFGGHFDPMATNTKQYGPNGVRQQRIQLAQIDTESECTEWRKPNKERQDWWGVGGGLWGWWPCVCAGVWVGVLSSSVAGLSPMIAQL